MNLLKLEFKIKYPNYACPYCGRLVGYVGRILALIFGARIHKCDYNNVKKAVIVEKLLKVKKK